MESSDRPMEASEEEVAVIAAALHLQFRHSRAQTEARSISATAYDGLWAAEGRKRIMNDRFMIFNRFNVSWFAIKHAGMFFYVEKENRLMIFISFLTRFLTLRGFNSWEAFNENSSSFTMNLATGFFGLLHSLIVSPLRRF